ncbi:mitochondrial 37S ribosomal protein [Saccharomycopsis crataegensis]|uniref:Small ribosomal subunit protein mS33 n=1 Tax=Saccharomycopsis crataegensis TaxID=43959 RepID=A0AAV5QUT1_9ASCO|nr:mitochondrial 37S ribosomal protein [Saccharomycopsis crataegensis]
MSSAAKQILKNKFQALSKIRSEIFGTNFNPEGKRTGAKILRQRLVGPTVSNYYNDPNLIQFRHLKAIYPQFDFVNEEEEYRLTMVAARKRRGKGAPAKTKGGDKKKKK